MVGARPSRPGLGPAKWSDPAGRLGGGAAERGCDLLAVELSQTARDLVANPSKRREYVLRTPYRACGILESDMHAAPHVAGEHGASLIGMVADRDDEVEGFADIPVDALRVFGGDVDADFAHGFDSRRMHPRRRPGSCRVDIQAGIEGLHQTFRHLASGGISGAEDKDSGGHCDSIFSLPVPALETNGALARDSSRHR